MAILSRHFPKILPVYDGVIQYDDLTMCQLQNIGGPDRFINLLEKWHKKSLITFMKTVNQKKNPWVVGYLKWVLHKDALEVSLDEGKYIQTNNKVYDLLHYNGHEHPKWI